MDSTQEFTNVSFCTGMAGIELGLKRVVFGFRTVAACEIEAYAVANL